MDGYKLCDKIQDLTPLQIHFTALVFKEKLQMVAAALGAPVENTAKAQQKPKVVEAPPSQKVGPDFQGPLYLHRSRTDIVGRRPETKVYDIKKYIEMRRKQWGFEMQPLGGVITEQNKEDVKEEAFVK